MRAAIPLCTLVALASLFLPGEALAQRGGRLRVQINSTPSGAAILIDGERQTKTTSTWVDLRRGAHKVRLELAGHSPHEEEINVTRSWVRFNYTLTPVGHLELRASDETATGATVSIDGREVGPIPLSEELPPGRYRVVVRREGYHDADRWIELSGGQTYATDITLRPLPPPMGEVLVAADVSGAQVLLDAAPAGTTPTIIEASPGEHAIEIRSAEFEPFTQTVTVTAGGRVTVNATLRPTRPPGGTLLVMTAPEGALVLVDGQERGASPATVEELPPGTHIVEARLEGYEVSNQTVEVAEGHQATVRLELREIPRGGGLRVTSTIAGAEVLIDGRSVGTTPLTHRDIEPGEHLVVVRSPGHRDWERRLEIESGVELLVEATPDGFGRLTVNADVEGAQVLVDGTAVGNTPLVAQELTTGDHTVEIRAEGQRTFRTTVTVEAGATNTISAQLTGPAVPDGPAAQEVVSDRTGTRYTRAGFPPPPGSLALDAAWGWPYLVGAYRFGVGLWDGVTWARLGLGLEVRSTVWLTEIDVRLAFGTRFARVLRIGAELGLGIAVGPDYDTTTENRAGFILNFTLTESVVLRPLAFGLTQRLEFWVDTHGQVGNDGLVRDVNARVFVGGFVEVPVHRMINVFVQADYAPVQPERRNLCADAWNGTTDSCPHGWMRDVNLNVQAGVGFRFR